MAGMAWRGRSVSILSSLTIHIHTPRRTLKTQARTDHRTSRDLGPGDPLYSSRAGLATPRQLVQYLDEFVVGQNNAKKVLSVAVFNHYNRVRANLAALENDQDEHDWSETTSDEGVSAARIQPHPWRLPMASGSLGSPLFEKSNVLVMGPTGSGKTLLVRTLAKVLDVPFSVSDATSFTQAGYVGEDVEMCVQRLLQAANWDPERASTGIIYIDEVDKIARKSSGGGMEGSRDVGGEGVQQALLRMMEGTTVTISAKPPAAAEGPAGPGLDGRTKPGRGPAPGPRPESYQIDTSHVLFILSGAFVGLDGIVKRRVATGSIGFTANLPPKEGDDSSFMSFFTPNHRATHNVLDLVEPADLVKFGFIPEFISRLPSLTALAPLTIPDLRRILTDVRGSLISQYTALFGYSGVEIRFTSKALSEICKKASGRGGGARGLRSIMENLLLEPMYEVPGSNIRHVLITDTVVRGEDSAMYWSRGEGAQFWAAWAEEEAIENRDRLAQKQR